LPIYSPKRTYALYPLGRPRINLGRSWQRADDEHSVCKRRKQDSK